MEEQVAKSTYFSILVADLDVQYTRHKAEYLCSQFHSANSDFPLKCQDLHGKEQLCRLTAIFRIKALRLEACILYTQEGSKMRRQWPVVWKLMLGIQALATQELDTSLRSP